MHGHSSAHGTPATTGHVLHWARWYDAATFLLTFGRERRMRRETVERAGVAPGQSVLDVGCGTGSLTLAAKVAAGTSGDVHGIDPAPEMIGVSRKKAARKRVDIDFRVGVIEQLPFPDASFDVVLSSLMLHHLPDDLKRRGLAEAARVLKPGGRFFAVDMAPGSGGGFLSRGIGRHFIHKHVDDLASLTPMLTDAGFRDVATGKMSVRFLGYITGVRA
ncbi:MAG: methyltransferase domain-containing protein [Dehalococcoidia bacterium]|nr:MAG: methyltransferase domain-containing protein [Dehalococcoidia bacterium]